MSVSQNATCEHLVNPVNPVKRALDRIDPSEILDSTAFHGAGQDEQEVSSAFPDEKQKGFIHAQSDIGNS